MQSKPRGVFALLIANGLMFAATWLQRPRNPGALSPMDEQFALWFPKSEFFAPWQFITHMFMHGSPAHLMFNMLALFSFGSLLESIWGTRRFVTFFLLCGLGAGFVQTGVNWIDYAATEEKVIAAGLNPSQVDGIARTGYVPDVPLAPATVGALQELFDMQRIPMVGASGAVYGVLIAFVLMFPNAKLLLLFLPIPIAAKYIVPALLALDVIGAITGSFSLFGARIAHFAHLGGALIGFLLMWHWRRQARQAMLVEPMLRG